MTNERIGSFIAIMRKERNMTQEQLAERLGVTNRSISRWENGKTLPDISLMQSICEVLNISISELLNGEREAADMEMKKTVTLVAALVEQEKERKAREVNGCLIPGGLFLAAALGCGWFGVTSHLLEIILGILGMGLLLMAIFRNSQKQHITDRELEMLSQREADVRMKTAGELIQFSRKHQKAERKQQRKAFEAIAKAMTEQEYAVFAMTGSEYRFDDHPGIWHGVLVLTNKRLLLCGESVRGRLMTYYIPEWLDREEICSIESNFGKLVIRGEKNKVTVAGENMAAMAEKLKQILDR